MPHLKPVGHQSTNWIVRFVLIVATDAFTSFGTTSPTGRIRRLGVPGGQGVRLDSALFRGLEVTPFYDSMLAKLVVHAEDRDTAIARAIRAIREFRIVGVTTSMPVAMRALDSEEFRSVDYDTGILERIDRRPSDKVLELAALAAAIGKFLATEDIPVAPSAASRPPISAWNLLDRAERLGRGMR